MKYIVFLCLTFLVFSTALASNIPQVTITGKVLCNQSKNPIASSISVMAEGKEPIHVSVEPSGKFALQLPFADHIKIIAEAEGYELKELIYDIPQSQQDTALFIEIYMTPQTMLVLEGNVLDAKTKKPIEAELDLFFDSDIVKEDVQIIHDGKYREVVSKQGWYILDIMSPGYLSVTDTIWLVNDSKKSIKKDYHLTPIEVGMHVVIENVYFYFGHTLLKPESSGSLDKIVEFIKANPTMELEIAGHTDDEGADDYNLTLSQGRAEAVVQYLVKVGVEPSRLTAKGYGESKPIDKAKTKAAKARNRRVEFTILKT